MHVGIGCNRRPDVHADWRRIDELRLTDALSRDRADVRGQCRPVDRGPERREQALEHERRLARTRHARHHRESPLRNPHAQRFDRMDRLRLKQDFAMLEKTVSRRLRPHDRGSPRQIGPDHRIGIRLDLSDASFGNDATALAARLRAHLDDPIGLSQDVDVMIDEKDRVAVRHQVVHHGLEPLDVGGMEPDRRFVQHVEHARRAVAHGPRELHALPLARRERRGRTIKRQVSEPEIQKPRGRVSERLAETLRHRPHLGRERRGHAVDPSAQVDERHAGDFVDRDAHNLRRPRGLREP